MEWETPLPLLAILVPALLVRMNANDSIFLLDRIRGR